MKKIALLTTIFMIISMISCSKVNEEGATDNYNSGEQEVSTNQSSETEDEKDKFTVRIESNVKNSFTSGVVKFSPVLKGVTEKELQYHWIIEGVPELGGTSLIDGFEGENGAVTEVVNSGESVKFGVYAEVSYVEDSYSERKVILKVEEKGTGEVLATDELTIENKEGLYTVKQPEDDALINTILKTSKARLYGKVFDNVWGIDSGLNSDIKYISIDTESFKEFDEIDKTQLFEYLEKKYDAEILDMGFKELENEGYIKDLQFQEGILFKIDKYIKNNSDSVSFEVEKWASGLGAIGVSIEAEYKDGDWEIKKSDMIWIS